MSAQPTGTVMITVELNNGDWIEAETPEGACLGARTIWDEAFDSGTLPQRPCITFKVGDRVVFQTTKRIDLDPKPKRKLLDTDYSKDGTECR